MEMGGDWIDFSKHFPEKRQFTRATAKASYSNYEYSNEKSR
jgi:hypothetical protein